jgi:hypothetical protein
MNTSGNTRNAGNSTPIHFCDITNTQEKNINLFNLKMEKDHRQKMTIKNENKKYSVNQFLTNHPQILNDLSNNFNVDKLEDLRNEEYLKAIDTSSVDKKYYTYDKEFKTRKELNLELLKFIINLMYYEEGGENDFAQLDKIFYLSYYLINRKFIHPFKIVSTSTFNYNLTTINKLYNYVVSGGKKPKPIFNDSVKTNLINEDMNLNKNCCICLDDFIINNNFISCQCSVEICQDCFNNLNPRRCPLCRSNSINLKTIRERTINFNYNNKNYIKEIDLDCIDSSEIVLIYLDIGKLEIVEHNFKMNTYEYLKENLIDNLEDTAYLYTSSFLLDNLIHPFSQVFDLQLIEHLQNNEEREKINIILGFIENDYEYACEAKESFLNNAINTDGMEHLLMVEFFSKIVNDRDGADQHDYYLYSDYPLCNTNFKDTYEIINNSIIFNSFDSASLKIEE